MEATLLQFVAGIGFGLVGAFMLVLFVALVIGTWRLFTEYHG